VADGFDVVDDDQVDAEERDLRAAVLRAVLPACQPQEGSPANTFTDSELQELSAALLPQMNLRPRDGDGNSSDDDVITGGADGKKSPAFTNNNKKSGGGCQMMDITGPWLAPTPTRDVVRALVETRMREGGGVDAPSGLAPSSPEEGGLGSHGGACRPREEAPRQGGDVVERQEDEVADCAGCPQEAPQGGEDVEEEQDAAASAASATPVADDDLYWHGAPRFARDAHVAREFRRLVREGKFTGPTNGVCGGFLQCNLVVLPKSQAFDFLLFCQRNPKSCPLIEVCDAGSPHPVGVARGADLRTDVPKYAIYRDGKLEREVTDVTEHWPADSVAFLIGCSFSYDGALTSAGIPLRSAEAGRNVPMYRTNLPCRSAGTLRGNMVVSMKPIPAVDVARHVEITSKYKHAHGGPVCVGNPACLGIDDLDGRPPDWGERIEIRPDEVPVFHACGVTPQSVLMDSRVPFAITHAAGHMFVTDLPSDMGV